METRGERIKRLRRALNLSQQEVARLMGIESKGAVSQWEKDLSRPKDMERLANILQTNSHYLESGDGDPKLRNVLVADDGDIIFPLSSKRVPLISWVQAGNWTDIGCSDPAMNCTEWLETSARISERAFALRIHGDSMRSISDPRSIAEGAKVIVEPVFDPDNLNRKIVVAMINGSTEATIKEFIQDGPIKFLRPLNPAYPSLQITDECRIVGVVKQIVVDL